MLNYIVYEALENLKWQIRDYEKKRDQEKSKYRRRQIEGIIEWLFERGLNMIQFSKPGEVSPWLIDYFLNRKEGKPNMKQSREKEKDRTLPPPQQPNQALPTL